MSCCKVLFTSIILILIILACSRKVDFRSDLEGIWDASQMVRYLTDTISIEDRFEGEFQEIFNLQTPNGRVLHYYRNDSLVKVSPDIRIDVLQLSFSGDIQGFVTFYFDLDTLADLDDGLNFPNDKIPFKIASEENQELLILNSDIELTGRMYDTLRFTRLSNERLLIDGDTLKKVR